ncbi:MAG: ATP-binding cassette domain-containing protein [Bacteroidales bacterium]
MNIYCTNVIPVPMSDSPVESDIWYNSISFTEDTIYHIVAPSGTGKTSLVSFLFGIRNDYHGTILFDNTDISSFNMNDWSNIRRSEISIVFQGLALFPDLTVLENITIKNKLTGYKSTAKILSLISEFGLDKHTHKPAQFLSFGQKQRVAIIRALCQPFSVLLLDEPFSHLDTDNVHTCLNVIEQETRARGATALITSLNHFSYTQSQHVLNL